MECGRFCDCAIRSLFRLLEKPKGEDLRPNETTRPLFVDFYYFLAKKGKCFKLYV